MIQSPPRPTSREIAHAKAIKEQKDETKRRRAKKRQEKKKTTETDEDTLGSDADESDSDDDGDPPPPPPSGEGTQEPPEGGDESPPSQHDPGDDGPGGSGSGTTSNVRRNPYSTQQAQAHAGTPDSNVFVVPCAPPHLVTRQDVFGGSVSDITSSTTSDEAQVNIWRMYTVSAESNEFVQGCLGARTSSRCGRGTTGPPEHSNARDGEFIDINSF